MKHFYTGLCVCLCCAALLFSCRNESTQEIGMYTGYTFPDTANVVRTTVNYVYVQYSLLGAIKTYYLEGYDGVPFVDQTVFAVLWQQYTRTLYKMTQTDSSFTITRTDNNVSLTIDASAQTISSDYFMKSCLAQNRYDSTHGCSLILPEISGFFTINDASATAASPVTFDINTDYGLKMYAYTDPDGNKKILMPAQLAGLILSSVNGSSMSFNGTSYYINKNDNIVLNNSYFAGYGRGGTRTRAEAEFNYRLLCMLFDRYYGLQHLRATDMNYGFNTFVYSNNLDQALLSSDPAVYDDALVKALMTYVDDVHTYYSCPSYYESASSVSYYQQLRNKYRGPRYNSILNIARKLTADRKAAFNITDSEYAGGLRYINNPDTGEPAIAVITFDGFKVSEDDYTSYASKKTDIADAKPEDLAKVDSFELFYNALTTIKAKYPDIKNIIIDESCNGGGVVYSCLFLANMFIQNPKFCYSNKLDGSWASVWYNVDTDLDGDPAVNTGLDLSSYHVYVLTSGLSFSCGNMFPSIMKDQRNSKLVSSINLIGQKSGGGGCPVLPAGTGDGAMFQTSSNYEVTYTDKSSVDGGVDVDTELDYSVFYNDKEMYDALTTAYPSNF